MTEEDLKEDELTETSDDQQQEAENTVLSDDNAQHTGTARTITASKILKANLAC